MNTTPQALAVLTASVTDLEKTVDANHTELSNQITNLSQQVAKLVPPIVTPSPPSGSGGTGSTGTTQPPSSGIIPMVSEDFTAIGTADVFVAKYGLGADAGFFAKQFEMSAAGGIRALKYNILKGSPAAPHWQITLPERGVRHAVAFWKFMFGAGFHIACPNPSGSGYKYPSWGWAGADSRAGGDFSNGSLLDSSIGIKTPTSNLITVKNATTLPPQMWIGDNWWYGAYEIDVTSQTVARSRMWFGKEGQPMQLLKGANNYDSGTIPNGVLELTVPQTYPLDRFLLGENFNQTPDVDMAHYCAGLQIINLEKYPGALAALGLVTA